MDKKILEAKKILEERLENGNMSKFLFVKIIVALLIFFAGYLYLQFFGLGMIAMLSLALKAPFLWFKLYASFYVAFLIVFLMLSEVNKKNYFCLEYMAVTSIINFAIAYYYLRFPLSNLWYLLPFTPPFPF